MRRNLLFVGALALLAGCSAGTVSGPIGALPTAAQLRTVPLTLGVAGKNLTGETHLWRDLMPGPVLVGEPTPKRGIIVSFSVKTSDSAAVPGGLQAKQITVAKGEEVWASAELELRSDENSFGGVVRNGPEWEVGSTVDVVIDFRDGLGETYQLRAVGQVVSGAY